MNTLEKMKQVVKEANRVAKSDAYSFGYDCGINGADTTNCHFSIFRTPEMTKDWEQGNNDAKYDKIAEI